MEKTTLDDLKLAWKELSRKLDRQNAFALCQFKENKLAGFRSGLRPLLLGQLIQLIVGALIAGFSAQFWISHIGTPYLVMCGLLLHAYGIILIAFAAQDLVLIRQIDYAAPVMVIQKRLADVGAWHLRKAVWLGVTGSVTWLPVMLIALYLLGADFWIDQPQKVSWLISSVVVCLAVNFGLVLLARSQGKCGRTLRNSWIGRSVTRAQEVLDEVEQFERELN